jgi:ribonucleoside-triphosphate reductase
MNNVKETKYVQKRDGSIVDFDEDRIYEAVKKASISSGESVRISNILKKTLKNLATKNKDVYTVAEIQTIVENALMSSNYKDTARAYIIYRSEHDKVRENMKNLMSAMYDITFKSSEDVNDKRDNANINTDTAMGAMLKYGTTTSNYFIDHYILPKDIAEAHINGYIHIHDKDFYGLTETCCQIDLSKLYKNGFSTGHGYLRTPNSIASYASLAAIALQANQNEMHGGQAIPAFDYYMADGIVKTFKKEFKKVCLILSIPEQFVEKVLSFITTIDCKDIIFEFQKENLLDYAKIEKAYNVALSETDKACYQAMEGFVHNLNTLHSRSGGQVPFSSINYGTDTSPEGRMVIRNLLLATQAGLGHNETPIFPVQIFKVKEGINFNEGDPNYDLFELAMETSAKRLFPNFSFIDSPFNLKYYKKGNIDTEIAYMGCRTRTISNVNGPEICTSRGNLSFTTIILPKLAIESDHNIDTFFEKLDFYLELCKRQLLHRLKIQSNRYAFNYPFLMGQGVWLDSEKLHPEDTVREVLKHGSLSIGFIGLAETLIALVGKHHGEDENARELGLKIISHMRDMTDKFTEETHLNFALLATPAEGLTGRAAKLLQEQFGIIEGVTDKDYLTNSFHVPPYYKINAANKIAIEAPYHSLTNGGHITYVEFDGDPTNNIESFKTVIRYMKEQNIGYGSINHPIDRDSKCGYTGIINNECPCCHRKETEIRHTTIKRIEE